MADDHGTGKVTHMGAMRTWTEIDGEWFYKNGVPCVSDPYNNQTAHWGGKTYGGTNEMSFIENNCLNRDIFTFSAKAGLPFSIAL